MSDVWCKWREGGGWPWITEAKKRIQIDHLSRLLYCLTDVSWEFVRKQSAFTPIITLVKYLFLPFFLAFFPSFLGSLTATSVSGLCTVHVLFISCVIEWKNTRQKKRGVAYSGAFSFLHEWEEIRDSEYGHLRSTPLVTQCSSTSAMLGGTDGNNFREVLSVLSPTMSWLYSCDYNLNPL